MQCKKKKCCDHPIITHVHFGFNQTYSFCGRLIAMGDTEGHHCSKLTKVSSSTSFTAKISSKTIPVSDSGNPLEHYMNPLSQAIQRKLHQN
jgi:hypothetical protein